LRHPLISLFYSILTIVRALKKCNRRQFRSRAFSILDQTPDRIVLASRRFLECGARIEATEETLKMLRKRMDCHWFELLEAGSSLQRHGTKNSALALFLFASGFTMI
jgi:hypothetical protein